MLSEAGGEIFMGERKKIVYLIILPNKNAPENFSGAKFYRGDFLIWAKRRGNFAGVGATFRRTITA